MTWTPDARQSLAALLSLPLPLAALSPGLRYVGVSEAWAELYTPGQSADTWEGAAHLERFPGVLERPEWAGPLESARAGVTSGPHVLVVHLPGDDVTVLQWWAVAWPGSEGGALILAQDITDVAERLGAVLSSLAPAEHLREPDHG